jgi:hypothetical protein
MKGFNSKPDDCLVEEATLCQRAKFGENPMFGVIELMSYTTGRAQYRDGGTLCNKLHADCIWHATHG